MIKKIVKVIGALLLIPLFFITGTFSGMAIGGNTNVVFNGAYGYEAGGQLGAIFGSLIGIVLAIIIIYRINRSQR